MGLKWPPETVLGEEAIESWQQPGSNCILDFHGDPLKADLAVFSDGNHHMALLPALKAFHGAHPRINGIFYATTPPYPISQLLRNGALRLGNLTLAVRPHVFISPPHVLAQLKREGFVGGATPLARNRGSALLVPRGNPENITVIRDLLRDDLRLFISNPQTEQVSYRGYRETLEAAARWEGLEKGVLDRSVFGNTVVYGACIHHREAPEAVAAGRADAAIVYYHLALRYTRIFPDSFEMVALDQMEGAPDPWPAELTAEIHMGCIDDGGPWGELFLDFMQGDTVAQIYARHGLQHIRDIDPINVRGE